MREFALVAAAVAVAAMSAGCLEEVLTPKGDAYWSTAGDRRAALGGVAAGPRG
ncbi:hypothetical protein [Nocardia sp. NPDC050793]|uniref:hypothetical protein n=1 Tax=Nocardia sp. NPDC050793 TaxID=3155159 RepID=UPI0033DAFE39